MAFIRDLGSRARAAVGGSGQQEPEQEREEFGWFPEKAWQSRDPGRRGDAEKTWDVEQAATEGAALAAEYEAEREAGG
jgi:hypothetical protein